MKGNRKMIKKTLAGFATAAMLLPVGFVTASPASAQSWDRCSFNLEAPDETTTAGDVEVTVYWQYSSSGASVKPSSVIIYNGTGRSITLTVNRWQNYAGTTVNRGPSGTIGNDVTLPSWTPSTWIPRNQNPFINVGAAATTRPGMNGSVICLAP
jgi:hypothetical protein